MVVPSMTRTTVAFGSPVPVNVGRPPGTAWPWVGEVRVGATGAVTSTVNCTGTDGALLPAPLVAVASTVWLPSVRSAESVRLQLPSAAAVAVPTEVPSTRTVTVLPAGAVPETSGRRFATAAPLAGALMTGWAGALLSLEKRISAEAVPVLPARSRAVAAMAWEPSLSAGETVHSKRPAASATTVQTVVPSTVTTTVAPGSEVPPTVGVPLVRAPSVGERIVGGCGAVTSTVRSRWLDSPLVLPAPSTATATTS